MSHRFSRDLLASAIVLMSLAGACASAAPTLRIAVVPIVGQDEFLSRVAAEPGSPSFDVRVMDGAEVASAAAEGRVDAVIAHRHFAPMAALERAGVLSPGVNVFRNALVLLAPPTDPANIAGAASFVDALARIRERGSPFVQPRLAAVGVALDELWRQAGGAPPVSQVDGGRAAVSLAANRGGYAAWGLHPWAQLPAEADGGQLLPYTWPDPAALMPMALWTVTKSGRSGDVSALANVLRSAAGRQRIRKFRLTGLPQVQAWWPDNDVAALAEIANRGRLIVVLKNDKPGAAESHRDPAHAEKRKFEAAVADILAQRLTGANGNLDVRTLRGPDRLAAVAAGEADLGIAGFEVQPVPGIRFSIPYFESEFALLHRPRAEDAPEWRSGDRIAVVDRNRDGLAARITAIAGDAGLSVTVRELADYSAAIGELHAGSVDALAAPAANLDGWLAEHPDSLVRGQPIAPLYFGVAVRSDAGDLLGRVNEILGSLKASGELARLARQNNLTSTPP